MKPTTTRRDILCSVAVAGATKLISGLPRVSAFEAARRVDVVRFLPRIEPLVRLLEETPREAVLETFAERIKGGTVYADVLAALHLAGIRNIPPRPDVGWKFHAVLVIHSAHLASQAARPEERWLPIFFALDFFKRQQAYDASESDWSMVAVQEPSLPAEEARKTFVEAMDRWDDDAADRATAALVRAAKPDEVFELFAHYGMRDFRNIGHKPIYMANGWRTLEYLGWAHAEPMLRSLVYAYLNHHDAPNPSESDLEADAPWRHNQELVERIRGDWSQGKDRPEATLELLATLREGTWSEASEQVVELLNEGASPQSIQDALFAGSAELLMRQPGIYALHSVTSTNGLQFAYRKSTSDATRQLLLMQNASFVVQFRDELAGMGEWGESRIDRFEPASLGSEGPEALDEIFEQVGVEGQLAAGKVLAYLRRPENTAADFITKARRMSMLKCRNGHDYKFSSAVMEDYGQISPRWRDRYLAASVHYLRGTADPDNGLVEPTLAAIKA